MENNLIIGPEGGILNNPFILHEGWILRISERGLETSFLSEFPVKGKEFKETVKVDMQAMSTKESGQFSSGPFSMIKTKRERNILAFFIILNKDKDKPNSYCIYVGATDLDQLNLDLNNEQEEEKQREVASYLNLCVKEWNDKLQGSLKEELKPIVQSSVWEYLMK